MKADGKKCSDISFSLMCLPAKDLNFSNVFVAFIGGISTILMHFTSILWYKYTTNTSTSQRENIVLFISINTYDEPIKYDNLSEIKLSNSVKCIYALGL